MPAVPPTPKALHSLVTSIPAKTLHAYLLDNIPAAPPDILDALASLFATLSPPPLLHCVRCHEDYIDTENGDRSCRMPHDEDSTEIEWVGYARGEEYETEYGCCGKTVEGEGDLGPPDGWCYEGMHTTDAKRARFRDDSTSDDDMLVSCLELNCPNIRARSKSKSKGKSKSKARAPKPKAETVTAATPASIPARGGRGPPRSGVRVQGPRSEQESDVGRSKTAKGTTEGKERKRRKVAHTATA